MKMTLFMILWKNRVLVVSNIERYRQNFRSVCRQDTASRCLSPVHPGAFNSYSTSAHWKWGNEARSVQSVIINSYPTNVRGIILSLGCKQSYFLRWSVETCGRRAKDLQWAWNRRVRLGREAKKIFSPVRLVCAARLTCLFFSRALLTKLHFTAFFESNRITTKHGAFPSQ